MDNNDTLSVPVLFLVFNRPIQTRKVFEAIRQAKPTQLFIASDGPHQGNKGEEERCAEVRYIVEKVDWECDVKRLIRNENLGCGRAISDAITWFFEHVEEGIILEDDTLPSPSFFRFCAELLEYYRHDTRIMEIAGFTFPNRLKQSSKYSYYLSDWDNIWGWATWRRAWKHYDYTMRRYPEVVRSGYLIPTYTSLSERYYMEYMLNRSYHKNSELTWWSVQWGFARKINSGLTIIPLRNLVLNIGFGDGATNTKDADQWNFLRLEEMNFPLKHPEHIIRDFATDAEVFRHFFTTRFSRFKARVKHITPFRIYDFFKSIVNRPK